MIDVALVDIFENAEALAHSVAERLCTFVEASERTFAVCLAASQIVSRFTWSRTHWFWGDERFLPHEDNDSNYRMTRGALLSRVTVPDDNIHAVLTVGLSAKHATTAYKTMLKRFYGAEVNWIGNTRRSGEHGVIACSALTRRYPDALIGNRADVGLIHLKGDERLTTCRIATRHEHACRRILLHSQFEAQEGASIGQKSDHRIDRAATARGPV